MIETLAGAARPSNGITVAQPSSINTVGITIPQRAEMRYGLATLARSAPATTEARGSHFETGTRYSRQR